MKAEQGSSSNSAGDLTAWNPLEAIVLPAVRSWGFIVIAAGFGVVAGVFLAFVKPNEYQSNAKLHVKPWLGGVANVESVVSGETGLTPNADIANQFHLLTSEEVFRQVAEELGPLFILQPYDPAGDDNATTPFLTRQLHRFQSWWFGATKFDKSLIDDPDYVPSLSQIHAAVEVLKANTSLNSDGQSNIIDVFYRTHDGLIAQAILQCVLKKHEERHLQINSVKPVTKIWRQEQKKFAAEWEASSATLNKFRDEHQISDLDSQIAELFSEKEKLERELDFGDKTLHEFRKTKLEKFRATLATTDEKVLTDESTEKRPNPAYVEVYTRLKRERENRLALLDTYNEDSFEVKQSLKKINGFEEELSKLEPMKSYDVPQVEVSNWKYTKLKERIEELQEIVEEGTLGLQTKERRLVEVSNRLTTLRSLQTNFDELRRKVEQAQHLKGAYDTELTKLSLTKQLEESSQSNLTVWTPPTVPFKKSGPQRMKLVIASIGAGVFAGFALALVRNVMDRSVRRRKALETLLGVPCLAVVPTTGKWSWRQARRAAKKFPVEG